jgi:hypothetical protein
MDDRQVDARDWASGIPVVRGKSTEEEACEIRKKAAGAGHLAS